MPAPSRLTATQTGALVVASMVGTGVFTTSGLLVGVVGSSRAVLAVWVLGGLLALAGAAVYAELGAMIPRVGGEYAYLTRAFSPVVGFVSGFLALVVGFAAPIAAGAAAFGQHLVAAGLPQGGRAAGLILIAAITALHARDVRQAARLQVGITGLTLLALVGLLVAGLFAVMTGATVPPAVPPEAAAPLGSATAGGFALGLVIVSYSYFGWNAAAYVAGETDNPQRTLPRALLLGCGLVTLLYVALNAVFLAALPPSAIAGKVAIAHLVAGHLFGPDAARALSLLIAVVLAASVSALVMTGPRVYLAMAEDGLFPRLFAGRNRLGAPTAGVLVQGILALVLYVSAAFDTLLTYVGFTLSACTAATVAAALWLRRKEPATPRPFRTPGWPLVPLAFLAATVFMIGHAFRERPAESSAGAFTVALGFALAWLWHRRRAR